MPIGRPVPHGLSLLVRAIRCFFSSAPHGVSGNPSGMLVPRSPKVATGGVPVGGGGGGAASCPRQWPRPSPGARVQTPERSGFPLAVRGTGASRLGSPEVNRGTVGFGYFGHCASAVG